jgi:hypothetical protein
MASRVEGAEPLRDDDDIYRIILAPAKRMLEDEKKIVKGKTKKRMIQNMIYAIERQCEYLQEDREFLNHCFRLVRTAAHCPELLPPLLTPLPPIRNDVCSRACGKERLCTDRVASLLRAAR